MDDEDEFYDRVPGGDYRALESGHRCSVIFGSRREEGTDDARDTIAQKPRVVLRISWTRYIAGVRHRRCSRNENINVSCRTIIVHGCRDVESEESLFFNDAVQRERGRKKEFRRNN